MTESSGEVAEGPEEYPGGTRSPCPGGNGGARGSTWIFQEAPPRLSGATGDALPSPVDQLGEPAKGGPGSAGAEPEPTEGLPGGGPGAESGPGPGPPGGAGGGASSEGIAAGETTKRPQALHLGQESSGKVYGSLGGRQVHLPRMKSC